jgi:hypothetical protein
MVLHDIKIAIQCADRAQQAPVASGINYAGGRIVQQ